MKSFSRQLSSLGEAAVLAGAFSLSACGGAPSALSVPETPSEISAATSNPETMPLPNIVHISTVQRRQFEGCLDFSSEGKALKKECNPLVQRENGFTTDQLLACLSDNDVINPTGPFIDEYPECRIASEIDDNLDPLHKGINMTVQTSVDGRYASERCIDQVRRDHPEALAQYDACQQPHIDCLQQKIHEQNQTVLKCANYALGLSQ